MQNALDKRAWGRIALFVASGYVGYLLGQWASAQWKLGWVNWSALGWPGAILINMIWPPGLIVMLITCVIGVAVLLGRLPKWTLVLFMLGNAVLTYWAMMAWGQGRPGVFGDAAG